MKHKLTLLITFTILACCPLLAKPHFSDGKRYHIVCSLYPQGCVTDGLTAAQNTPLYYLSKATTNDETYWLFTEEEEGFFSIKNVKTGQYITYDGVRQDTPELRRYVSMTNSVEGLSSLWMVTQQTEGVYVIRNAEQQDHIWDVRTDSYCVGTYSNNNNGNQNQLFSFYDEQNKQVVEHKEPAAEGFDVSSWLVADTDMLDGWTNVGGWFMNTGAGGSHYNGDANTVAPFIENWHDSAYGPLDDCALTQTLSNMPAGQYVLQADMIAVRQASTDWWFTIEEEPATGVQLFLGSNSVAPGTTNNLPQRYTVSFTLKAMGEMDLGVHVSNTNANWLAIDNVMLFYQGTEEELLAGEKEKVKAELSLYYESSAEVDALIANCGDDFDALEELRRSVAYLPAIDPLAHGLGSLTIDNRAIAWTESVELYLASIPEEHFGKNYTATINYNKRNGWGDLTINGTTVPAGSTYTFSNVRAGATYTFAVKNDDGSVTHRKRVTFTALPVVKIYGSFNNSYSDGYIQVFEPSMDSIADLLNMKAKWRGGITNNSDKHKRNYHVKLKDAQGEKLERKFFDLRSDNSWILESCQVDMSRIRNRTLTDLWNDYSTPPYYIDKEKKAKTGTRGEFVELILNDEYRGIYCMTENIDRKQMKLKKYDEETGTTHGQLWKSKDWSFATLMGTRPDGSYQPKDHLSDPNAYSDMWDKYEVKYPDFEDYGYETDWSTLYNAVEFVCYSTDEEFRQHIAEYFDLPLVIDYYILMETILATDNHGKNMFFAVYDKETDKRITFAVWDMDATCGQRWSDQYYHWDGMRPDQDYATYIARQEHGDYNLFKRLRDTDADDFNMKVRLRYRELRQSHLATNAILNRFSTYLNRFKLCGAAQREYNKWNGDTDIARLDLNFDTEMQYITDWFTRRMDYLDTKRFDIASLPELGIASLQLQQSATDVVYDLQGRRVSPSGQLPTGIYIVNGKKVIVK